MTINETFFIQLSHTNMKIIWNSFNEVCNGFVLPDFEKKIGMTLYSARDYMENLEPVSLLVYYLNYKGEEILPKTQKQLTDGYIAYWDEKSRSVVFEALDKTRIVYQPEKGMSYFTKLATMDLPVESEYELSLVMRLGVSELTVLLAVVREAYEYIYKEIGGGAYHARIGRDPDEAEEMMEKMQKEIEKHTV